MTKQSDLTDATVLDAADGVPVRQSTNSKEAALSLIRDWILANAGSGTAGAPSIAFASEPDCGFMIPSANNIDVVTAGVQRWRFGSTGVFGSISGFAIGASVSASDVYLVRDGAAQLALRNTTNAQSLAIYNTYTDASNYERLRIYGTAGDVFTIASEAAGTGTVRGIAFATGGTTRVAINTGGTTTFSPSATTNQAAIFNSPSGGNSALHIRGATVPSYASAGASPAWTTTTTGVVAQGSAGNGGIAFSGFTGGAATNSPVYFAGYHGNVSSTAAAVAFVGRKHDGGTNFTSLGSTQLVAEFVNSSTSLWSINGAGLLQGGGITSSFPALKRSGTILQARLADDSAYGTFQGKLQTDANAVSESITPTHTLTLYDAAGTAYKVAVQAA